MFTGIVENTAEIVRVEEHPPGRRIAVAAESIAPHVKIGDSVAISGCCLTAVAHEGGTLEFDAGPETLSRTTLGDLAVGSLANLECSLRIGDFVGGHFVTGHVDTVGTLDAREDDREWSTFWFAVDPVWTRQMVSKGSIAVDGVSLTLVDVEPARFSVQLIPHTLEVTTLGPLVPGGRVNLETDLLAKYAQKAVGETS